MTIIADIKSELPKNAMITDICYEGSEIIFYTKNREFFRNYTDLIKKIVNKIKKRVEESLLLYSTYTSLLWW